MPEGQSETRTVGVLSRYDSEPEHQAEQGRLKHVFEALAERGVTAEEVRYSDERIEEVRDRLLRLDGVIVWVDPLTDGQDRSRLDPMLREVASAGIWVSTHPDVIMKMGTKDVLVRTQDMAWGTNCHLYRSLEEFESGFPRRLEASSPRVVKQHRGNGGNGVWKVEPLGDSPIGPDSLVRLLHAQRGSSLEDMTLGQFMRRCAGYFTGSGCIIDQPYQARLAEGMIRCYLVQDRVAGFGHQFVTALLPPREGSRESPPPPPRLYYGPEKPEFQMVKSKLENEWVPEMQRVLGIETASLPALWDADFLYGPKDPAGEDTYVLCEINVSSVLPFPDEALAPLADVVVRTLDAPGKGGPSH